MKKLLILTVLCLLSFAFFQEAQAVNFSAADGQYHVSDDVVVLTKGGKPILPDLERSLGKPAPVVPNEITFSFDSPAYPWSPAELEVFQQWVRDLYPVMKAVYGSPAFDIVVNVRKDPTIVFSGEYNPSTNEIVLTGLDIDVFSHETIHAFHDDLVIGASIYEEGMTRAAEVAVLGYLPQYPYWDSRHSYDIDVFYEMNNQPEIASPAGSFFLGFPNVLMKYQQAGYAWGKVYIEDNDFFVKFNAQYYVAALSDPSGSIQGDVEKLEGIADRIKRRVEKQKFADWYQEQYIFNINPEDGYQTVFKGDTNTLYVYSRLGYVETPLSGINVSWQIFSCQGELLSSGSDVTGAYGWVDIPLGQLAYQGKVQINVKVDVSPDITIERSILTLNGAQGGIFGVTSACEGEVTVRGEGTISRLVVNGSFSIAELENIAGTFTVKQGHNEKTVTKDASRYFVSVP